VGGEHRDAVAERDTLGGEAIGEAPGQCLELAEGDARALARALDEDLVPTPPRVVLEQRIDVGVGRRVRAGGRSHRERYCSGEGDAVKERSEPCTSGSSSRRCGVE